MCASKLASFANALARPKGLQLANIVYTFSSSSDVSYLFCVLFSFYGWIFVFCSFFAFVCGEK